MPAPIAVESILRDVLDDVAAREAKVSFQDVKARSRSMEPPRDARAALLRNGCSVITELKRAVPYRGQIAQLESPQSMANLAIQLEQVGVHLMACQTERRRFHGSLADMTAAREATTVPMICRDLIVDPYQIHEARCYGADVVPLQVGILEQARLESLLDRIESLGMVALLEVRNPEEVDRVMHAGGTVVGINAWSLTSDALHREAFAEIVPGLPESVIRIAVGGVESPKDLLSYASSGADAVMVGESVMTAQSPSALARGLVATGQHPACPSRKL
ncbi:indole-3-glycerol phosphate synthase TrpC [Corynebacterium casei]|uniref:indole-3-glycerol-phosphate synthase n=1 Tax=Corynebacterium casei LMG S-19264 TaxID=1285583 RepID=A0ABN4CEA4_9CORY|nr:indole-3-glycerol phosphate synthase TrpC [Corynebacterium casei]AHI19731.1 indole-3-glycerol phosphate synthase [Corynebacterium casei LMG S-19264]MDN5706765.1 indole-3-glycerol phosphate synthase TrpC [Corynebacterium casei]MDN5729567.1 indole-3-glycerol phosphate synthase TrpC [Corynebacterium casei]MDN5740533.1 indole-3-glycerol phosphate synthase TrpC [Corynebacterium casei]MDN5784592.1 indole-3-glycerol phosphate synthase TrpC [Corynebacterium casei]